jgi:hypothetical protein
MSKSQSYIKQARSFLSRISSAVSTITNRIDPFHTNRIVIWALVGKSGTGKSYHAWNIAEQHNIDAIIDDGILIVKGFICAGISAKTESTSVAAVKRAIFINDETAKEVMEQIDLMQIKQLLILGTSDKMVHRIAENLHLSKISRILYLNKFVTPDDVKRAVHSRKRNGHHVIPASEVEVQKRYPSIFIKPIRLFSLFKRSTISDKVSVVKPQFSQNRKVVLTESALHNIVRMVIRGIDSSLIVKKVKYTRSQSGFYSFLIALSVPAERRLSLSIGPLQRKLHTELQKHSSLLIDEVRLLVKEMHSHDEKMPVRSNALIQASRSIF